MGPEIRVWASGSIPRNEAGGRDRQVFESISNSILIEKRGHVRVPPANYAMHDWAMWRPGMKW